MRPGKILKKVFMVLLAGFIIFLAVRMFLLSDKSALSELEATDAAIGAYAELGDKAFSTHRVNAEISRDGYFSASAFIYNSEKKELQLTGRYNTSLYGYMDAPEDTEFSWELRDSSTGKVYTGKVTSKHQKYLYHYRKIVFSDVEITEESELLLFLRYGDKYPLEETEGFNVHYPTQKLEVYKLSKNEKSLLAG